jgi:uncharacterized MAPEG superfamily protein
MDTRTWLLATVGFTACLWIPYVLDRFIRIGVVRTLKSPQPSDAAEQSAWALRAKAAHINAIENLVLFAPLALMACQSCNDGLAAAGAAYFVSRVMHFVFYTAGIPALRTVAFLGGFGAQMFMVVSLLRSAT